MSIDVTARVHVDREPSAVAAYMTDPAHDPEWIGGLREAELLGDGPVAVGSRAAASSTSMRFSCSTRRSWTCGRSRHPSLCTSRTASSPPPVAGRPSATGSAVAVWILAPFVRRNVRRDLERLRGVLES